MPDYPKFLEEELPPPTPKESASISGTAIPDCLPTCIVDLPPYSPEHNPCEQLWDLVKDELGNRIFSTIEALREALHPILRRWWEDSRRVLDLVGRP